MPLGQIVDVALSPDWERPPNKPALEAILSLRLWVMPSHFGVGDNWRSKGLVVEKQFSGVQDLNFTGERKRP
jgi:hypothetical protein